MINIIQPLDEKFVLFFQSLRFEALTAFFSLFIKLECWHIVAAMVVLYFFIRTKNLRIPFISYFLGWNGSIYSYSYFKDFFHRPRPFLTIKGLVPVITPHSFSFPSGHATLAAALTVVLAYHFPKTRYFVIAVALLVGISRVYLGVHYLSDVLAGYILGIIVGFLSLLMEKFILSVNKSAS